LESNKISDIKPLLNLANLQTLYLKNNQISNMQTEILKEDLENCRIQF